MAMLSSSSKLRLGIRSNASMFEEMGNPWDRDKDRPGYVPHKVTDVERELDKIRTEGGLPSLRHQAETLETYRTEADPEFDQFFANRAPLRFDRPPEVGKKIADDVQRKTTAILAQARNGRIAKKLQEVKPSMTPARPMQLQLASLARTHGHNGTKYSLYVKYEDGREEDLDRTGLKKAEKSFHRHKDRDDSVCVELWSYETGDLLMKYERKPEKPEKKG